MHNVLFNMKISANLLLVVVVVWAAGLPRTSHATEESIAIFRDENNVVSIVDSSGDSTSKATVTQSAIDIL